MLMDYQLSYTTHITMANEMRWDQEMWEFPFIYEI
jgi:hypothetical protein